MNGPLTQGQIEDAILRLVEALEDGTHDYRDICQATADAEADYKLAYHQEIVRLADLGTRSNVETRKARATLNARDLYRAHLTTTGAKEAVKDAQATKRAALDAMRTLAANVRAQT